MLVFTGGLIVQVHSQMPDTVSLYDFYHIDSKVSLNGMMLFTCSAHLCPIN